MKNLVIVHPGTGTVIPLSDVVYVVDWDRAERHIANVSNGEYLPDEVEQWVIDNADLGRRVDNYNIGNFLFGEGA